MIKDKITNSSVYNNISSYIQQGFNWIITNNLENMPDGKYEISDKIYANIQSYQTKESGYFEAHREYIDIQYMITGEEMCGIARYDECKTIKKYNKEKDIEFLTAEKSDYLKLQAGEFFIFFPQDAHQPSLNSGKNNKVKKVVIKIKI